jgi:hypothetical protein
VFEPIPLFTAYKNMMRRGNTLLAAIHGPVHVVRVED